MRIHSGWFSLLAHWAQNDIQIGHGNFETALVLRQLIAFRCPQFSDTSPVVMTLFLGAFGQRSAC